MSGNDDKSNTLPKGKYIMVSVDVDTTGRRLIDEVSYNYRSFTFCL